MEKGRNTFFTLTDWYFSHKTLPHWTVLLIDCVIVFISYLSTFLFYAGRSCALEAGWQLVITLVVFLMIHVVFFRIFRTYSGIIRYSSFADLRNVGLAMVLATIFCFLVQFIYGTGPEGFLFNFKYLITASLSATLVMWVERVCVKLLYDGFRTENAISVLVYGIGDGGVSLAKRIRSDKPARYRVRGFISHDSSKTTDSLLGETVYLPDENLPAVLKKLEIKAVVVPINRINEVKANEFLHNAILDAGVRLLFEHALSDSQKSEGKYALKDVKIEDLLPREQIKVDLESVSKELNGKRILVTGSAGSIGSELVRQLASFAPEELILVDQAETPQHDIRLMMAKEFPNIKAHTIVSSIDSKNRMKVIFKTYRPQYVFHAAAYKHVPMMEDNPSAAVHNNIRGTRNIADLSVEYGVEKFVMVSTDKAVNPTNVMGCSKRICEIYVQSLNKAEQEGVVKGNTQFVTTRFGNVLGSNGSVIPLFRKQIDEGGPVTVTHPDIIRYFMLIPEACKLVLEAGTKGKGGEIFVFDMGKPVRIADLAKRMIFLSGATNVQIEYTGLREGEKLYEELLNIEEITKPSFHEKIRIATVREYDYLEVSKSIEDLIQTANAYDAMDIVAKMKEIVPEYKSNNSVYSVLDK